MTTTSWTSEHKLSNVNTAERRAICAVCGPVKLRSRGAGNLRCANAANAYKRKKREAERVERLTSTALRATTPCCRHPFTVPPIGEGDGMQRLEIGCACGTWYLLERERHTGQGETLDVLQWMRAEDSYFDGRLDERRLAGDDDGTDWADTDIIDLHRRTG